MFVNVAGNFEIIRSVIVFNSATYGYGGAAATGGAAGNNGTSDGGGIYVYYVEQEIGTVGVTRLLGNTADVDPDSNIVIPPWS